MAYTHYGKIGDIWKHLPLCNFLKNEQPNKYIETNAAYPCYFLNKSSEQEYGIYTFFQNIARSSILQQSEFYQLLSSLPENKNGIKKYLGSPGLALHCLRNKAEEFSFFDIEKEPLEKIEKYAEELKLQSRLITTCKNSIYATYQILPYLGQDDFIHIDPYNIQESQNGIDYIDLFLEASERKIKCMLWYGFNTLKDKENIAESIKNKILRKNYSSPSQQLLGIEILIKSLKNQESDLNPGVMGCGIIINNLSKKSMEEFQLFSLEIIKIYEGVKLWDQSSGELEREIFQE